MMKPSISIFHIKQATQVQSWVASIRYSSLDAVAERATLEVNCPILYGHHL